MISFSEIAESEIIKVLVEDEDEIQEECYAQVTSKEDQKLYVHYLEPKNKVYKDATLFSFSEDKNEVELESITEHHEDVTCLSEIGFMRINDKFWVKESDIDSECSDSEIEDYSSEENNSFIAPEDIDQWEKPHDHAMVDSDWNKWVPKTSGERHFKNMVDRVEKYAKVYEDEMRLS